MIICAKFPLDKLLGVCYNGISARGRMCAGRQNVNEEKRGSPLAYFKHCAAGAIVTSWMSVCPQLYRHPLRLTVDTLKQY